jgi:parallel beta-helix repeat protein
VQFALLNTNILTSKYFAFFVVECVTRIHEKHTEVQEFISQTKKTISGCLALIGHRPLVPIVLSSMVVFLVMLASGERIAGAATVTLSPGANIQQAINSSPAGTTFLLNPGLYRMQSLSPKTGDSFIGQTGAILVGSTTVTNWTRSGNYWISTGQPALNTPYGPASFECQSSSLGCAYPQDIYFNNKPLVHKLALPIVSGQWYFDYARDTIYLADNPSGQLVELSVTQQAISGYVNNVTVQNLTIEKYAAPLFSGAITPYGSGWIIEFNTITLNHGDGIKIRGSNEQVLGNTISYNGQGGISVGGTSGNQIKNNQILYNNFAKCSYTRDSAGVKVSAASNNEITGNTISYNDANGAWTDSLSHGTVISSNNIAHNTQNGIRHEYSSYGTIANNVLTDNSQDATGVCTFNTREIVAADSNNVTITGNTITSNCAGITLTQGTNRTSPNVPVNLVVTDNVITYPGSTKLIHAIGGQDSEQPPPLFNRANNNYFDYNTYHFSSRSVMNLLNWEWDGSLLAWDAWRAAGQDTHGTAD